ncbi:DUF1972 domain-containing protein [Pseudokineococcus sp. 5B2Z-1]|uniref:DUF1972 domain-containing protein n=1 Tax=Pseudokineococcus sp. 5B2Z-1 TaxID=3132744 RepID=UPI0030AB681F
MRVSMIGTRGVPARYGGFETCVEEVGRRLVDHGYEVVVYCRGAGDERPAEHLGMRLVHLPALQRRSLETLSHTGLSVAHSLPHPGDVAFVFNAANAPFLPALRARGVPVVTHVDGLEWQRAKWGPAGKRYYRTAEALAVRWSDALIADAEGIRDYYRDEFDADTELISYGAPVVQPRPGALEPVGLEAGRYHLVVARFEPENHVDLMVEGYRRSGSRLPLVVAGSAPYADEYTRRVHAAADGRVRFLGGVWDQDLLDQLYAGALTYLHGHSVGGTNPSLLRAMGAGAATTAFDVRFNREVLREHGRYVRTADDVAAQVAAAEADVTATLARGERTRGRALDYDWDVVADAYASLAERTATRGPVRHRPSGRRRPGGSGTASAELSPTLPAPRPAGDEEPAPVVAETTVRRRGEGGARR